MLSSAWKKMLIYRYFSKLENNRQKENKSLDKKYIVDISNQKIFHDLSKVLKQTNAYSTLFIRLFEDMNEFNFISTSSVTDGFGATSKYGNVKLYKHSINTFFQMLDIVEKEQLFIQKDIFLIIAILHDFGKSHVLCDYYQIDLTNAHHIRSSDYFKIIVENSNDNFELDKVSFEIIYKTLRTHHEIVNLKKESIYSKLLKNADSNSRANETIELEEDRS